MEKLKLSQKMARSAFIRTYGAFQIEIAKQPLNLTSLKVQFEIVRDKASELESIRQRLMDTMLNEEVEEEVMLKEIEHADEYLARYHQAKIEMTQIDEREHTRNTPVPTESPQSFRAVVSTQEGTRTLKLPKIELRKFGGDIKDWLSFWATFQKIHEDKVLPIEDKFYYLLQSMIKDSRAAEIVNSFPPTTDNYKKAIQSLQSRFGKKDLLIEYYVRELLKLVLNKNRESTLMTIYDKLETHMRALESLGVTTDMCAAMLFPLVESSLPEELLRTWQRYLTQADTATNTAKDRLDHLMSFLGKEVESEERILMAKAASRRMRIR